jgi:hypothetical protein
VSFLSLYVIFYDRFKPREVQSILKTVLAEFLEEKKYDSNLTTTWTRDISTRIRDELKGLNLPRYKFMVQVIIGEMKGAGARVGCRCLWDNNTDKLAEETYINDSIFAVAVAFGIYLY